MELVTALLRVAIRLADAAAGIVAFDDEQVPIAFLGCSETGAEAALRGGEGIYIDCGGGEPPVTLVLLEAMQPIGQQNPALTEVAREIGSAARNSRMWIAAELSALTQSIEAVAEPAAVFSAPLPQEEVARFAAVNAAFQRAFGYERHELMGQSEDVVFAASTNLDHVTQLRERLAAGGSAQAVLELQTREGIKVWTEFSARAVLDDQQRPAYYLATMRNVSARKEFEAAVAVERERLRVTLQVIEEAVISVLPDGRIEFINEAGRRLLNVSFADAFGMPLRAVVDLRDDHDAPCEIVLDPNGDVRGEGLLYGPERNVQMAFHSAPLRSVTDTVIGYVIVLRDVTAQARLTRRLAYEASHDPLTRLPNRRRFVEMVADALESARTVGTAHAVAFIDLERFKGVTERFGSEIGNQLLREIAQEMAFSVRGNDILARLSADTFAALLHECPLANAERVMDKLRTAVEEVPLVHEGESLRIAVTIGLAGVDRHSASPDVVLAAAEAACMHAKPGVLGDEAAIATRSS